MIKDLIVEYLGGKFLLLWRIAREEMWLYIWYRFYIVDNQEMMSFGYSDKLQNMGLFVEFKATGWRILARSEIDFVKFIQGY